MCEFAYRVTVCYLRDGLTFVSALIYAKPTVWIMTTRSLTHFARRHPRRKTPLQVGVLGCMAERLKDQLLEKSDVVSIIMTIDYNNVICAYCACGCVCVCLCVYLCTCMHMSCGLHGRAVRRSAARGERCGMRYNE